MTTKLFFIEHKIGEDYIEYEYEVEADYEPFVPGRLSGPPEDCYPDEGGGADVHAGGTIRRRLTQTKDAAWEKVPWSIFVEGLVEAHDFTDDPADSKKGMFRKTAAQKAEQYIEDEMAEAGREEAEGRYEAAMDARFDEMNDERDWD